jgi:hypothetical protein
MAESDKSDFQELIVSLNDVEWCKLEANRAEGDTWTNLPNLENFVPMKTVETMGSFREGTCKDLERQGVGCSGFAVPLAAGLSQRRLERSFSTSIRPRVRFSRPWHCWLKGAASAVCPERKGTKKIPFWNGCERQPGMPSRSKRF